ncbi:MAG: RNA polymerase sigma factor, ECF family [Candidatus Ozemobacter sibiricus]|uniref:RNA polymerase sigma factor, ECF family n=1 Tax=Candidatus Ozemobacter sibiricus TaxID=2268124 RepID=A0A367ZNG9_9BACT|nr:MAG: RNA polymerase sigma factor, ECF family [Candidatus Ozemobacter sibiricus]
MAATRAGRLAAFETLVDRYQGLVFRFLFHFMGHRGDAEDITQETFLQLFRKLDRYDPAQSLKAWLLTMARHLAISHHRRQAPAPLDPAVIGELVRDVVSGPEAEVLSRDEVRIVHEALHQLPDEYREVLVMRYLLDMPLQKVAEVLNIPEGTAKSRVFHARGLLRDALLRQENRQAQMSGL